MTKQEIIHFILTYNLDDINSRLDKLMEEKRITGGARYYVYNPYENYGHKSLMELLDKASKSKDYTRYLKRVDSFTYRYLYQEFTDGIEKTLAFIQEQENLPFEETQMQVLIQKGELR